MQKPGLKNYNEDATIQKEAAKMGVDSNLLAYER